MNGTFLRGFGSSMSFADMCLQGENYMEVFTLFSVRGGCVGCERRTKWTEGRSLSWVFLNTCPLTGLQSLCNNCGLAFERDKRLPPWAKNLHLADIPVGRAG